MGMSLLQEQGLPICSRCPWWGMGKWAENLPVPGLSVGWQGLLKSFVLGCLRVQVVPTTGEESGAFQE